MFNILYIVKTSDRQLSIHGNGYYLFVYKAGGGPAGITGTISSAGATHGKQSRCRNTCRQHVKHITYKQQCGLPGLQKDPDTLKPGFSKVSGSKNAGDLLRSLLGPPLFFLSASRSFTYGSHRIAAKTIRKGQ